MTQVPRSVKPTGQELDRARAEIERCGGAMDGERLADPTLNAALEPFRARRPLRLRCPQAGCRRTLAWIALAPTEARVIFSVNGPRKGHVDRQNREGTAAPNLMPQPPEPYNYWSLGPSGGVDSAQPANPPHTHSLLRWNFICEKCKKPHIITNRTMLTKLLDALTGNSREVEA